MLDLNLVIQQNRKSAFAGVSGSISSNAVVSFTTKTVSFFAWAKRETVPVRKNNRPMGTILFTIRLLIS